MKLNFTIITCFLCCISCAFVNKLGDQTQLPSLYFRDAVVIDQNKEVMYLSNADQNIECLDLITGKTIWTSKEKGSPLFIKDDKLFFHEGFQHHNKELVVSLLNVKERELPAIKSIVNLEKETADFRKGGVSMFYVMPATNGNTIYLAWSYQTIGGGALDSNRNNSSSKNGLIEVRGDTFVSIKKDVETKGMNGNSIKVDQSDRINNLEGHQYMSKDDRNVLVSKHIPGQFMYEWKIFDRKTKKLVGAFKQKVAFTSFIVKEETLVFEKTWGPLTGKDLNETHLQIVWYDLKTNKLIASKEVYDSQYRGPLPPSLPSDLK